MPSLPKVIPHRSVFFVTTSVEEGLLFTANPLIEEIIKSCLARAISHHPVILSAYYISATHMHFIICVDNPEDLKGFMERFKTESAHAINKLLGRQKRTIWCEGYDSPVLLDPEKVIEKLIYIYTNPARDNLTDSIDQYPGLNSWGIVQFGETFLSATKLKRTDVPPLPKKKLVLRDYKILADQLIKNKENSSFLVHPTAWMKYFGIVHSEEIRQIQEKIQKGVKEQEALFRSTRTKNKISVIGAKTLSETRPGTFYQPERTGKKTCCLSSDRHIKRAFMKNVRYMIARGKEILAQWRQGDFSEGYPLGLYPPSLPRLAYSLLW